MPQALSLFWFRRDLRTRDNTGLFHALKSGNPVLPLFIFDRSILDKLPEAKDGRVEFIHNRLTELQAELRPGGSGLCVKYGFPLQVWQELLDEFPVAAVYTNHDYEPYAGERDGEIRDLLASRGIPLHTFKDQVIFEKREILSGSDNPYTVFTPYSKKWKASLRQEHIQSRDSESLLDHLYPWSPPAIPSLAEMGFEPSGLSFPEAVVDQDLIKAYAEKRDYPAVRGTSRLSVHLRFGTVSIRSLVREAGRLSETWLNELIWRDFYQMILANFPHVVRGPFKPQYAHIPWRVDEEGFEAWKAGKTGYPMVDAGMRELAQTGFMHNRVRMVTASFLCKHLLIDWQWGEAWFAQKLLDFDLASNNGGWQWAAGTGCDAAPYFRIFNPASQLKKFDPQLQYVRKWVPEYGTPAYPKPIVEHKFARERCLAAYKNTLNPEGA